MVRACRQLVNHVNYFIRSSSSTFQNEMFVVSTPFSFHLINHLKIARCCSQLHLLARPAKGAVACRQRACSNTGSTLHLTRSNSAAAAATLSAGF
jgi:hypothetical protein